MTFFKRVARRLRPAVGAGMSTAEYAVGTVAAVAFAVVLYKIVRSDAVSSAMSAIIRSALHALCRAATPARRRHGHGRTRSLPTRPDSRARRRADGGGSRRGAGSRA